MKNTKTKYNIALALYIAISFFYLSNPCDNLKYYLMSSYEKHYYIGDITLSAWAGYFGLLSHSGIIGFLLRTFVSIMELLPIYLGIVGASKEKKILTLISTIMFDLYCICVLYIRISYIGTENAVSKYYGTNYFGGDRLSIDTLIIFVCVIILNVIIFNIKKEKSPISVLETETPTEVKTLNDTIE